VTARPVLPWKAVRALRNALLAVGLLTALGYTLGLGIYAVASTAPAVPSQPENAEQAREAVRRLGIEREYSFEHGFAATPHGRMHYAHAGQGDPVLCLHGNPTWSFLYREFLRGLSDDARVIAPDLIGFGLSEKLPRVGDYSIDGHVEDVVALVDALDLRNLTLVLQDWGGPIGLGVASRRPERVRALVIMNTIGFVPEGNGGPPFALRMLRAPLLGEGLVQGLGLFHRGFIPLGIARPERRSENVLRAYREVQGSWTLRAGTLAFPRLIPATPEDPATALLERTGAFLESFHGPVLLIWGMRDPFFDADLLAQWRERFPDAPVLELEDAGHFLQEDAPERIVPRVREFLASVSRS
jgi:haloalkane dehalogenase